MASTGCLSFAVLTATAAPSSACQIVRPSCPPHTAAAICSCCPALAELIVSMNESLNDWQLEGILSACSALQALQAIGCSSITLVLVVIAASCIKSKLCICLSGPGRCNRLHQSALEDTLCIVITRLEVQCSSCTSATAGGAAGQRACCLMMATYAASPAAALLLASRAWKIAQTSMMLIDCQSCHLQPVLTWSAGHN